MPAEVRTVDPTRSIQLHSCWKNVSLVVVFTALHSHIYPQTALSIHSVRYFCPCKALIQLQKDFLSLACTPTLSGSCLSLSTSRFLICYSYTHTVLSNSASNHRWPKIHHNHRTMASGGVQKNTQHHYLRCKWWANPSSKKCRARCICTHRKVSTSASKIPQGSPRERKLFQEPIPLPFLKAFKNQQFFTGIPHRQGKVLKGSTSATFL